MKKNNQYSALGGTEVSIFPVMQGDGLTKLDEASLPDAIPVLALRNAVLFPGTVYPVTIGREKSIRLIRDVERADGFLGAVPQKDITVEDPQEADINAFGTLAKVIKTLEMPDGTLTAILQGFNRISVDAIIQSEPYMVARVHYLDEFLPAMSAMVSSS